MDHKGSDRNTTPDAEHGEGNDVTRQGEDNETIGQPATNIHISETYDVPMYMEWQWQDSLSIIKCHKCGGHGFFGLEDCPVCEGVGSIVLRNILMH
jgi:DnaJ-class molecular chaperone